MMNNVTSIYLFFLTSRICLSGLASIGAIMLIFYMSSDLPTFQSAYGSHCIAYEPKIETIALLCGVADLFDISDNLGPNHALIEEPDGACNLECESSNWELCNTEHQFNIYKLVEDKFYKQS